MCFVEKGGVGNNEGGGGGTKLETGNSCIQEYLYHQQNLDIDIDI